MKNMVKILSLISAVALLSGCATTGNYSTAGSSDNSAPVAVQGPLPIVSGLATPEINSIMSANDKARLYGLVAFSPKDRHAKWHSDHGSTVYEFTSTNIFVNDEGQACRTYDLTAREFIGAEKSSTLTACRNQNSRWYLASN